MLSRRIIPCLDVNAGRVVKGVKFQELRDAGDPVQCAKAYDAQGADELVFLDITASSDARTIMHDVVAATAGVQHEGAAGAGATETAGAMYAAVVTAGAPQQGCATLIATGRYVV